jgi:hypothetical protein
VHKHAHVSYSTLPDGTIAIEVDADAGVSVNVLSMNHERIMQYMGLLQVLFLMRHMTRLAVT